jgi:hypothetical protein
MLGFLVGILFMLALPRPRPAAPAQPAAPSRFASPPARPRLTAIEDVFAVWAAHAVWENDLTEVALWNTETRDYSDFYEVLRAGDAFYFRTIPHLTRPILTHGVEAEWPLRFTEPAARREEWLREKSQEDWKALGRAIRPIEPPAPPPPER